MEGGTAEPAMDADPPKDMSNDTNVSDSVASEGKDHPEEDEIRRQVEYYFSDENLPTDAYLLQLCGGRENLPVRMGHITGFKKMRKYKSRKLVVAALRKSDFLEVSDDGKTIKRKTPLQGKCLFDKDFFEDDEIAYDPRTRRPYVWPLPQLVPNQANAASGLSKNMLKPTGFEKAYVEPLQTPEEAKEEEALYDPAKPFVERIEIAIQRFKQRRRMHQMYSHVFEKFMRFGGVDSGPRMYQGLSTQDLADMDAEGRVRALATHFVPWERGNTKKWTVDFVSVGSAFLSSWYPDHYGFANDKIKNACQVLRSFYNYLLYHKVCPEHDDQLLLARGMCDTAEIELPKIEAVRYALPGDFNKSASVIFGGAYTGMYTSDKSWAVEAKKEGISWDELGICDEEANIKFTTAVAIMGSDEQYRKATTTGMKVISTESTSLEVTAIHIPEEPIKEAYAEQSKALRHKLGPIEPLGKIICKSWYSENYDGWDLPKDDIKYRNGIPDKVGQGKQYEFWMEESVLEKCFVGMKFHAIVLVLEDGMVILDEIQAVMCSFYTSLLNELWMKSKPKAVRWKREEQADDENESKADENMAESKAASDDEFDDE